jgi:MFS transporter, DHA2 family, multidrug resistance protein
VHSVGREFKVSDPVRAVGEASATGETQSLVHHPPHTEHDVSGAPDRVAPTINRVAITISIMLATIMQAIDTTIANVALPHIQGSLSAAQDQITWVLTSYIVAAAIMTPLTGWLAGAFGIKRVFLISVIGFTVASALCGLADSLTQMVLFRLLQGVCGAALMPLSQAVLLRINPPERHGQAMAVWGTGAMVGPIAGPALGGWLTDNYNWRWVFYINLPVGIIAFLGILFFIHETRHARRERFDFFGFGALAIAIGALQMLLDRGELKDWFHSTEIWVEVTVAGLALYLFVVHTITTSEPPFLNRALLRDPNFVASNVLMFFIGVIMFATLALQPTMLQQLMNYPVATAGLVTAPRGIGTMVAMFLVGRIINRVDTRLLILGGLALTTISLYQMSGFTLVMDKQPIIVSGLVQGFGLGFVFVPLSTISFATLPRSVLTQGTALFSLTRNIGSSIGIAILEALFVENSQIVHSRLVEHLRPDNPLAQAPYLMAPYSLSTSTGIAALNAEVTKQAQMVAYIDDFKLMMVIAFLAAPLLLLLRKPRVALAPGPIATE